MTVDHLFEEYIEVMGGGWSESVAFHHDYVRAQIEPVIGYIQLRELEYRDIEMLKSHLRKPHKANKRTYTRSPRTINIILGVISKVLQFGIKMKKLGKMPEIDRLPQSSSHEVERLTREQVETLRAYVNSSVRHRQNVMITVILGTGIRPQEFDSLDWKDVNLPRRVILIRSDRSNKLGRKIPISDDLLNFLVPISKKLGRVCEYKPGEYKDVIRRISNGVGFKFTAYTLRKTFASVMVEAGVSPFELAKIMGHANVSTTYKYYTDLQHLHLADAMSKNPLLGTNSGTQEASPASTRRHEMPEFDKI